MFPMLSEPELHDLAEDIKAHSQLLPIVLDPDGVLLDGRNRLAACELAGVAPAFTTYSGTEQTAYIASANIRRRHVTEGQRSMIHAMVLSVSGHSLRTHAKLHQVSRTRLSLANTVLKYAPDLAEKVRDGKLGLDAAGDLARERKARADALHAQHERVRRGAPDLATQVTEGHLTFDAASQMLEQRQEAVRQDQQQLTAIAEHWPALQDLARDPDSLHTHQVLDGLTPDHCTLITRLLATEAKR